MTGTNDALVHSYIDLYTYILTCSISCGLHPLWIYQTWKKLNWT